MGTYGCRLKSCNMHPEPSSLLVAGHHFIGLLPPSMRNKQAVPNLATGPHDLRLLTEVGDGGKMRISPGSWPSSSTDIGIIHQDL